MAGAVSDGIEDSRHDVHVADQLVLCRPRFQHGRVAQQQHDLEAGVVERRLCPRVGDAVVGRHDQQSVGRKLAIDDGKDPPQPGVPVPDAALEPGQVLAERPGPLQVSRDGNAKGAIRARVADAKVAVRLGGAYLGVERRRGIAVRHPAFEVVDQVASRQVAVLAIVERQRVQVGGRAVAARGLVGETEQRSPVVATFQVVCQVDSVASQGKPRGCPRQPRQPGGMRIAAGEQARARRAAARSRGKNVPNEYPFPRHARGVGRVYGGYTVRADVPAGIVGSIDDDIRLIADRCATHL